MFTSNSVNKSRMLICTGRTLPCAVLLLLLVSERVLAQINFSTPPGYVMGFRDYLNSLPGNGVTQAGPITYVGNYGASGSGYSYYSLTDGINENGVSGAIIIVDPTTGLISTMTDFGDLHAFNIAFDRISGGGMPNSGAVDAINVVWWGDDEELEVEDTLSDWQSAEALRISDWQATGIDRGIWSADTSSWSADPNPVPRSYGKAKRKRLNGIGMLYGVRIIEREDFRSMYATGSILGTTTSETVADNHVMGPAIGLVWIKSHGPWTARLQGLVSMGFNSGEVEQYNTVGAEQVPGATNRLLYSQPTESSHRDSHDEFSPNGELRAEANLRITETLTFAINWSGIAVDNALMTDSRTRFYLPDMGLVDPGNQQLPVHNFFCGIEMVR